MAPGPVGVEQRRICHAVLLDLAPQRRKTRRISNNLPTSWSGSAKMPFMIDAAPAHFEWW
jgi:hypothetical protein